jgi:adenosine deaminase
MSIETLIKAMPKVDLHLQFEGTVPRETIMIMVDQNEVKEKIKRFDKWLETYQNPDFKKLDDLTEMLRSWIEHEDDLVRAVYDIGVWMNKDNIRYAEIAINPLAFVTGDFTFDQFIASINDGRDRAERAWGVKMRWVLLTARNDPRRAD